MKIKEATDYIQNKLLENNFIIHRYDAYSTNSCYLKLDWGAMNSIRISDHKGKEHLSYRYNINVSAIPDSGGRWSKDIRNYWRYYCSSSINDIDNLIELIINSRFEKKTRENYNQLIEKYKLESINSPGFWKQAKEVFLDTNESTRVTERNNK